MKVQEVQGAFGLENLLPAERPVPAPGPGEALLKLKAASLNYRDLLTVLGLYNPKQPLPLIPLSDGVGEVMAVGGGVTRVAVGDRAAGVFAQGWLEGAPTRAAVPGTTLGGPLDGMLAEYAVLHEDGLVKVPAHLSDAEAATLPCAAVTAWSALKRHGDVQPGDTVLTLGTGGVSLFAVQFAKLLGAKVIVTSSSDEKLARAKALGADHGINYQTHEAWWRQVREITDGNGADHVIELGGAGTLGHSLRSVRMGGHISLIGVLAGMGGPVDLIKVLMQDVRLQGVIVGPRSTFEEMNGVIAEEALRPVVDRVFPLDEARAALEYMQSGRHFGKICIQIAG